MHCNNINKSKYLRKNQTNAEKKLWSMLRNRRLGGIKFKRQFCIGRYILDFYSSQFRLCIEADGGQHYDDKGRQYDEIRTRELSRQDIRVLRFSDLDILTNIKGVCEAILQAVGNSRTSSPHPYPLPKGEREKVGTKKGIALVLLIMIIVLVVIIVAGLTAFVFESLRLSTFKEQELKTIYLAQAGIMAAIVDQRDGGTWAKATNVNMAGNQYYHVGKDANFLWVDPSIPRVSGSNLKKIPIKNMNSASSITITSMILSWTFGGNITKVTLGGTQVWNGTASSGSTLDVTDFTIPAGTYYSGINDQQWDFSGGSVSGDVICTLIFSDGSQRKTYLLKDGKGTNKEFSITATGEVRGNATWRRTIEATYDTGTGKITSWQENSSHIIP